MNAFFFQTRNERPNFFWEKLVLFFLKNIKRVFRNKFFVKTTLVQLVILLTIQSSIHASDSKSLQVWIDFIEESDTVFVKGIVANLEGENLDLKYELNILTMTPQGETTQTKSNNFKAEAYLADIYAEAKIDFKKRDYFLVTFTVFDFEKNLIGTDTLESIQIDLKAIQPKIKNQPIVQNKPIVKTKPIEPKQPIKKNNPIVNTNPTAKNKPIVKKQQASPQKNLDALEIDGLILDDTRSKIGRDFYEIFYNRWTAPNGARDYMITIKELPSRGIGARISIQVNDNIVLYRFLQPRGDIIETEANNSISYLQQYLMKNENLKKDLETGDEMGSGIF